MRFRSRQSRFIRHCGLYALLFSSTHAAITQTARPAFEVASVRSAPPDDPNPNNGYWSLPGIGRFTAHHLSLALLIQLAYGVADMQIANKPGWLETNLYDIEAKPEDGVRLTRDELRPRLQELLRQRFHLVEHIETRPAQGYALVISKNGQHLSPTKGKHLPDFPMNLSPGHMQGDNWTTPQLAKYLAPAAGFPVVDQTGIAGSYDVSFVYDPKPGPDSTLPSLSSALEKATGLLLKPQKVPVEMIVIDSVDKMPVTD